MHGYDKDIDMLITLHNTSHGCVNSVNVYISITNTIPNFFTLCQAHTETEYSISTHY